MPNVNGMVVNYQTAALLAAIVGQATGTAQIAPVTANEFVSVAQTGLQTGYDPLMTAISQVLSRTIFSIRPYTAKFRGLMMDSQKWGNHVRKLNVVDKPFRDDDRYTLVDGQPVDQQIVCKPEVVQTNYYGQIAVEKCLTVYRDQLDVAFTGEAEFSRFISMIMQNVSDMLEQARETTARGVVNNLIAGVVQQAAAGIAPERVIHLVTEYNNATGSSLTATTVKDPANFAPFARWMFGYLKTISDKLTNRTALFHQNFTIGGAVKTIMRHTPVDRQKCYLFSPLLNTISANVLSTVFYDKYLQLMDHEDLDFFQSISDPMSINMTPVYTAADGTITNGSASKIENVFGVIFDEEAAGYTLINQWQAPAPFNSRGGYQNTWWHENHRYMNDFTENAVVLLLDEAPTTSGHTSSLNENRSIEPEAVETKSTKKVSK